MWSAVRKIRRRKKKRICISHCCFLFIIESTVLFWPWNQQTTGPVTQQHTCGRHTCTPVQVQSDWKHQRGSLTVEQRREYEQPKSHGQPHAAFLGCFDGERGRKAARQDGNSSQEWEKKDCGEETRWQWRSREMSKKRERGEEERDAVKVREATWTLLCSCSVLLFR